MTSPHPIPPVSDVEDTHHETTLSRTRNATGAARSRGAHLASRVAAALLLALLASPAAAQTPDTASAPGDTAAADTVHWRPIHDIRMPALIAGTLAVLGLAPAAGAFLASDDLAQHGPVDHVAVYVTMGYGDPERPGLAGSYSIQLLQRGVYAEARVEEYVAHRRTTLRGARVGYLARPRPGAAAGVTLGYRAAEGGAYASGLEIALPLVLQNQVGWTRFEAAYVASRAGVDWHYRWQFAAQLPRTPLEAGVAFDIKEPLGWNGTSTFAGTLLLGIRLR